MIRQYIGGTAVDVSTDLVIPLLEFVCAWRATTTNRLTRHAWCLTSRLPTVDTRGIFDFSNSSRFSRSILISKFVFFWGDYFIKYIKYIRGILKHVSYFAKRWRSNKRRAKCERTLKYFHYIEKYKYNRSSKLHQQY